MNERQRKELRRAMQPASQDLRDASVISIAGGMLLAAVLIFVVVLIVAVRSIGRGPGTHDFGHRFVVLDANGAMVDHSSFVFTMDPHDFDVHWRLDDLDSEGRVVGAGLSTLQRAELRDYATEVCLSEPLVFMWADNFEIAAEIPAGTCVDNRGKTQVVLR